MTKTALITGAYGFLGRHVARYFSEKGFTVIGIGHGNWEEEEYVQFGIGEWKSVDITLDSLNVYAGRPDVVVHCAGGASVLNSFENPVVDFNSTVVTTHAVLEFIRTSCAQAKLVYPSSAAVYGNVTKLPIAESASLNPASPYGYNKMMAEVLCRSYARNFNIPVTVVRLFSVYGPGLKKQLLWDASSKITKAEYHFFGTGQETRDWLHVDDAVKLLLLASSYASDNCPVVNGGGGGGATVREVLDEMFKMYKSHCKPHFTGEAKVGDPRGYVADITKAKSWGWQPSKSFHEGLAEYIKWYLDEHDKNSVHS